MRKFIISDIHGFGNVYYSIMKYLDNIRKHDEIELYINGDLIDRGYESAEILLDIKKRITCGEKITYLGGNHELMMYNFYNESNRNNYFNEWYINGGNITDDGLYDILKNQKEILNIVEYIGNLPIYCLFDEKIKGKNIVLVHAACPVNIKKSCNLKINDNSNSVFYSVWSREDDSLKQYKIGNSEYFTIIGHTPNQNLLGYEYHKKENYLNIDGGCAFYVSGMFTYNHFPLVEIADGYLKILTFNSNNEIIAGSYFDGNKSIPYNKDELKYARLFLENNVKLNKLAINDDGIVYYENEKLQKKI